MKLAALSELNRALQTNDVEAVTRAMGCEPGMRALAFESGTGRWEWRPADERIRNPFGTIYGGYLAAFADVILSSTIGTALGENELAITADLRVEFIRPAAFGPLLGFGKVKSKGSRVAFVDARIEAENGDLLASASSTWTIVRSA